MTLTTRKKEARNDPDNKKKEARNDLDNKKKKLDKPLTTRKKEEQMLDMTLTTRGPPLSP